MPGDLLVWGPCQEPSKQHTTEVPTLQCPGSGTCSGTRHFLLRTMRCWVHCTGRHRNSLMCRLPV